MRTSQTPPGLQAETDGDELAEFVSSGGFAADTRAVAQLKQVVTTLRIIPAVEAVNIPLHTQFLCAAVWTPTM